MELILQRKYYAKGTNGILMINGNFQCHTIELPWINNQHQLSCIPEGMYNLSKRYTDRLGNHLMVNNVPGRSMILIHPANDALRELKGCIAPVLTLTGEGTGDHSREALDELIRIITSIGNKTVFLTIKK